MLDLSRNASPAIERVKDGNQPSKRIEPVTIHPLIVFFFFFAFFVFDFFIPVIFVSQTDFAYFMFWLYIYTYIYNK